MVRWGVVAMVASVAVLGSSASAWATSTRTFVESTGTDTGTCARPDPPCRTFKYAITQTTAGGEIIALDSSGFGSSLVIDRAVTITAARGVYASMTAVTGNAITVNAPAGDDVLIEHL